MTNVVIDIALAIMVLSAWLAAAGFARLRVPLDRLHCVTFANVTAGGALVVAAFVTDGGSIRAYKILLMATISLLAGAATSHAVGRAIVIRGSAPDVPDVVPDGDRT